MLNPFDPMPTIEAILGKTMAQDIEQSILLAQLDDFQVPQCEGRLHDEYIDRHSGPAGFLLTGPCEHHPTYICVAYSVWLLSGKSDLLCRTCQMQFAPSEMTFTPIGGQK